MMSARIWQERGFHAPIFAENIGNSSGAFDSLSVNFCCYTPHSKAFRLPLVKCVYAAKHYHGICSAFNRAVVMFRAFLCLAPIILTDQQKFIKTIVLLA